MESEHRGMATIVPVRPVGVTMRSPVVRLDIHHHFLQSVLFPLHFSNPRYQFE